MSAPARVPPAAGSSQSHRPQGDDAKSNGTGNVQEAAIRQINNTPRTAANIQFARSVFLVSDFRRAFISLDYDKVYELLQPFGWTEADLDRVKGIMGIRRDEHIGLTLDIPDAEANMDEVIYPLLTVAITKRFFALLPALPNFTEDRMEFYTSQLANLTTEQLMLDYSDGMFEMFKAIMKKYKPKNLQDCIDRILADVGDQSPDIIAKLKRDFPGCNF